MMRPDVEIARAVAEVRLLTLSRADIGRAHGLGILDGTKEGSAALAREWLAKRDRKPASCQHDPQRYQTLIDRVTRAKATCARCHQEGRDCTVLTVRRLLQADGAECRMTFDVGVCVDCAKQGELF